jgi:hypothetical protein
MAALFIALTLVPFAASGAPNCQGCFNNKTGVCILDTDPGGDPNCPLATPADCKAINLPYLNNSLDMWPTGCLCALEAEGKDCMSVLEQHDCDDFTQHADTAEECAAKSKKLNATYIGFVLTHDKPGMRSINCQSIFKSFNAGCAGFEGAKFWTYSDLKTGEKKYPCNYEKPPSSYQGLLL